MTTVNMLDLQLSGASGTGNFAGTTSPTFVTPTLGAASATSINFGGSSLANYVSRTAFMPVVTFATPGDVSVVYANQAGEYNRIGNMVTFQFQLSFTPTYTTASGALQISTPIVADGSALYAIGNIYLQSMTFPAGATQVVPRISLATQYMDFVASGSGVAAALLTTTQIVSTVTYTIIGSISYFV